MSLDFIRGADDDRVEALRHRQILTTMAVRPTSHVGDCPRCGMVETYLIGALCHRCDDDRRDAEASRALCALIHRRSP